MGLFIMLENIDGQFLKSRFGNNNGQLYKCVGPLKFLGHDPLLYAEVPASSSLAACCLPLSHDEVAS